MRFLSSIRAEEGRLVEKLFGIDIWSLAMLRIGLALLLLCNLFQSLPDLEALYTDDGILPRRLLFASNYEQAWPLSLHAMSGGLLWQYFLFGVAAFFALLLLVGYCTRLSVIVSWILLLSLQARNPLILAGGEVFLRHLLFWCLFIPLGVCYSVDRALLPLGETSSSASHPCPQKVTSLATAGLLLQLCFLYWFSVAHKTDPVWRVDGTAIYYALSIDEYSTKLGQILLGYPAYLKVLTFGTLILEAVGPMLAFTPLFTGPMRTLLVLIFCLFHLSLAATLELGSFSYVCCVAWLAFLPSWFWDNVSRLGADPRREAVRVYYDQECGFCRKVVLLIQTFLAFELEQFAPAQRDKRLFEELEAHNSWIVVDYSGQHHHHYDGLVYLLSLIFPFKIICPLLRCRPACTVGNALYQGVANHRDKAGYVMRFVQYHPVTIYNSRLQHIVASFFLLYVFLWNFRPLDEEGAGRLLPSQLNWIGASTGMSQRWDIFAPPFKISGWHVAMGTLQDGSKIDLLRDGAPVDWRRPAVPSRVYKTHSWRKFLITAQSKRLRQENWYYARYLYTQWNRTHTGSRRLVSVRLWYMWRRTTIEPQKAKPRGYFLVAYNPPVSNQAISSGSTPTPSSNNKP